MLCIILSPKILDGAPLVSARFTSNCLNALVSERKMHTVNVFAINDDCNGNIWLSTNYGILRYNESKDNVTIYDKKDGKS